MPPLNSLIQRAPVITGNVCTTPECINASDFVKQHVNLTVDPCSDFYQYTCGSWLSSPEISTLKTATSTFSKVEENGIETIATILEGTYNDIFKALKTNDEGFHVTEEAEIDKANFQEIQNFYDMCTNVMHFESLGPSPLYQDIAQIQHTLFPLSNTVNAAQSLALTLAWFTRQGLSSLINSHTLIDWDKHDYEIAVIDMPDFSSKAQYNLEYEGDNEFLIKLVNWTMANSHSNAHWIEEGQRVNISYWSYEEVLTAVESYSNLTLEINQAVAEVANSTNVEFDLISLDQVQSIAPTIDWVTFLDDLVSPGYAQPTTSVYSFSKYLELLEGILGTKTSEQLQHYFIVRHIVLKISDVAVPFAPIPKEMSDNADFDQALHLKQKRYHSEPANILSRRAPFISSMDPSKRRKFCADTVGKLFTESVGRFYALSTFGGSKEKIEADRFVNDIQSSWLNHLPNNAWLDEYTKAKAIEKVKMLQNRIVYNTISPDWRSPASIKAFYEGFELDQNSFYNAKRSISVYKKDKLWKSLTSKYTKNQWDAKGYPHKVNAFYNLILNEIEIPIGIMQRPFYDSTFLKYLNYGALGSAVGHELSHALDSSGRHYNGSGHKEDWWTNHSDVEFEKRSQCFIDQYSQESYINEITHQEFAVDGNLTLGENIADSGGISIALMAYRDYINNNGQQPEPLLPGFETFTQEQMLFISYGISRCQYIPPDLSGLKLADVHAPFPSRVNLPMRNSVEFANAFKCAAGTPMNPHKSVEEKCVIW